VRAEASASLLLELTMLVGVLQGVALTMPVGVLQGVALTMPVGVLQGVAPTIAVGVLQGVELTIVMDPDIGHVRPLQGEPNTDSGTNALWEVSVGGAHNLRSSVAGAA